MQAEPSRRAYVRKINVSGNNRTRDEVIRREFRQYEAAWYDGERIRLSRDRVDRLGFFTEVNVETQDVPGSRPGGSRGQCDREAYRFAAIGRRFLQRRKGRAVVRYQAGKLLWLGQLPGYRRQHQQVPPYPGVQHHQPYFTQDGISRTVDLYYRTDKPYEDQGGNYELVTTGASMRFGIPFSETDTVFFGGGFEQTQIKAGTNIPPPIWPMPIRMALPATPFPDRWLVARRP